MSTLIRDTIAAVEPVDTSNLPEIRERLDSLTKPPGSLGRLEELVSSYCVMRRTLEPEIGRKRIYTFAGDHGVVEEGVSAYPQAVTAQMVANFAAGGAAINVLARHQRCELCLVDVGVKGTTPTSPLILNKRVGNGTANITKGPAMTGGRGGTHAMRRY